jgi:hypothetical protein
MQQDTRGSWRIQPPVSAQTYIEQHAQRVADLVVKLGQRHAALHEGRHLRQGIECASQDSANCFNDKTLSLRFS